MKRVVITGATGMIASALIRKLIKEDIQVLAICRPNSSKISNIPSHKLVTICESDVSDLLHLKTVIKDTYDTFFHFAWNGTYGSSRNDAYLQTNNIKYTLDAVNLANHLGCTTFIGAGSQAEYGRTESKLSALTPTNPENGYGIAKYTAGKLSAIYAKQLGLKHIWTRILSIYGPCDNDFTMIMSSILKMLRGEYAAFTKGEQQWDFLYCDDAAEAFYRIAKEGKDGSVYPIGSGSTKSLAEYITIMRDTIDKNLKIGLGEVPYTQNQVMNLCADISELTKDTGFVPQISFEKGISETIDWCKHKIIG